MESGGSRRRLDGRGILISMGGDKRQAEKWMTDGPWPTSDRRRREGDKTPRIGAGEGDIDGDISIRQAAGDSGMFRRVSREISARSMSGRAPGGGSTGGGANPTLTM